MDNDIHFQTVISALGYLEHQNDQLLGIYKANVGKGGYTIFAQELAQMTRVNLQGLPWCAVFVYWAFCKTFGVSSSRSILGNPHPGCRVLVRRMKRKNLWQGKDYNPHPWDLVFCANDGNHIDHCGIVESCDGHTVTSIDGNTVDPYGTFEPWQGGTVARRVRNKNNDKIIGYSSTSVIRR